MQTKMTIFLDYISSDFGVDSSSRFSFRAPTDENTDRRLQVQLVNDLQLIFQRKYQHIL